MKLTMQNGDEPLYPLLKNDGSLYMINENFLEAIGFEKNECLSKTNEIVFRYYRPVSNACGIELIFEKEFGVLSIEEFSLNKKNGTELYAYTIVGKFRISSDEDLAFIFAKNIRLNYLFNIDGRRV